MPPAKYHYLWQSITVSGLETVVFDKAVDTANEVYGAFDWAFAQGELASWNLTPSNGPSLEISNQYFTLVRDGLSLQGVPFQESVDPHNVLTCMADTPGAKCVHTEDNEVEYCQAFRQLDEKYKYVNCFVLVFEELAISDTTW